MAAIILLCLFQVDSSLCLVQCELGYLFCLRLQIFYRVNYALVIVSWSLWSVVNSAELKRRRGRIKQMIFNDFNLSLSFHAVFIVFLNYKKKERRVAARPGSWRIRPVNGRHKPDTQLVRDSLRLNFQAAIIAGPAKRPRN